MGIDQVAQVSDIVQAGAWRGGAERAQSVEVRSPKSKVQSRRAAGRAGTGAGRSRHEESESLRGTEKFGKTKTVVADRSDRQSAILAAPLVDVTARPTYIPDYATPRFRLTPRHFAYVKIAEGCNHPCSFCIIPRMRGSHRSRTQARHRGRSQGAASPTA